MKQLLSALHQMKEGHLKNGITIVLDIIWATVVFVVILFWFLMLRIKCIRYITSIRDISDDMENLDVTHSDRIISLEITYAKKCYKCFMEKMSIKIGNDFITLLSKIFLLLNAENKTPEQNELKDNVTVLKKGEDKYIVTICIEAFHCFRG